MEVQVALANPTDFGLLGVIVGKFIETRKEKSIPFITGIPLASLEALKSFSASIATYGGSGIFIMDQISPEMNLANRRKLPLLFSIHEEDLQKARLELSTSSGESVDFITLGCPHLSLAEIEKISQFLEGKKVKREFWLTTSHPVKDTAEKLGLGEIIRASGARLLADTCCVVSPIRGRFNTMLTDSAKACYYAGAKNHFNTIIRPFEEVLNAAVE